MAEERYNEIRRGTIRERLAFVARDSVVYGSAGALSAMINLLLLPFLTRLFEKAEFGALDSMLVLGAAVVAFIIMGQDSSIARYFYETEDVEERKQIVSQALLTELVIGAVIVAAAWLFAAEILDTVYGIPQYGDVFRWMIASFPFLILVRFASNLMKWTFARYRFVVISFGSVISFLLIALLNVAYFEMGIRGYFLAQVIAYGVFGLIGLWYSRDYITMPRGFAHGREMLSYGGPYMVTAVAGCLIPAIDRVMITNFIGLESTALYGIGYRYAFLMMLPINAFMAAWVPFTLAIYKESNAEETYNRGLLLMTTGLSVLSVVMLAVIEPIIDLVAGESYLPGYVVALPLMLALIIQTISHIAGVGIALSKRTRFTMYGYIIGVVSSAVLIWVLVQEIGILGAAIGALLGRLVQAAAYVWFAYQVYPIRFAMMRPATMVCLTAGAGLAMQGVVFDAVAVQVAYRGAVVGTFALLTWYALFNREERDKAVALVRERLSGATAEP